ncbi:MAG: phosphoribosylformylglycinamidine synthase subunit PurQ, partial [Candidatus Thermoplasmatota archaeon]|nr:phosphoribosylformylglycinamidine synthase subunit PurQ [Candidatus Thermoplasmatota archaeon]
MTPRVAVLFGFGINCDHETKAVFELVGAEADRVHVNRFVSGDADLAAYDILAVPGGFSFGDHLGSGRLLGNRMRFAMREALMTFVDDGKPIIGICNGFQVLVKTGLLPGPEAGVSPDF